MQRHPGPDDAHVLAGLFKDVGMDAHKPEDTGTEQDQYGADYNSKTDIGHQRHRIGSVELGGVLCSYVLGNEDGRRGTDDGKDQQHQIGHLIGVADGSHPAGVVPTHHDLIGVAHQHL